MWAVAVLTSDITFWCNCSAFTITVMSFIYSRTVGEVTSILSNSARRPSSASASAAAADVNDDQHSSSGAIDLSGSGLLMLDAPRLQSQPPPGGGPNTSSSGQLNGHAAGRRRRLRRVNNDDDVSQSLDTSIYESAMMDALSADLRNTLDVSGVSFRSALPIPENGPLS